MTHPVTLDALLERMEYAPHDGSPVLCAQRRGERLVAVREHMHLWAEVYFLRSLSNRDGWRAHQVTGLWDDNAPADYLTALDTP